LAENLGFTGLPMENDEAAYAEGRNAARADSASGRLVYCWTGHAGHWGHWIVTQLSERFGVGVKGFGICFVTASGVSFNDGYNSVLADEIDRLHGNGAFQSVFTEAKAQTEVSLGDARRSWFEKHNLAEPDAAMRRPHD
jgi:hypothetical protein